MISHRTLGRPSSLLAVAALATLALAGCSSSEEASALPSTSAVPTSVTNAAGNQEGEAALDGKTFTARTVTGHDLVAGSDLMLTFEDGQVAVQAGCNNLFGAYVYNQGNLEVAEMASTMMACEPDLMAQDTWITDYLEASPAAVLDGDTLTLTSGDTTIGLAA